MTPAELKEARDRMWMSQEQMAEALGVTVLTLNRRERGEAGISKETELAVQYLEEQFRRNGGIPRGAPVRIKTRRKPELVYGIVRSRFPDPIEYTVEYINAESGDKYPAVDLEMLGPEMIAEIAGRPFDDLQPPRSATRLTKHPMGRVHRGGQIRESDPVYQYRVNGMPPGQGASIADYPHEGWRILRWEGEGRETKQGEWYGRYSTADAALAALEEEVFGNKSRRK